MCSLKMYIETVVEKNRKVDPLLIKQLRSNLKKSDFHPSQLHLDITGCTLKDEYMMRPLIETYKCRQWQIRSLSLKECRIGDQQFNYLIKEFSKFGKKLEMIDMSCNDLT